MPIDLPSPARGLNPFKGEEIRKGSSPMRIIYGINPVSEALKAGPKGITAIEKIIISAGRTDARVNAIIKTAEAKAVAVQRISPDELDSLTGTIKHQGVAAVFITDFKYRSIEDIISSWKARGGPAFLLLLDSIQDPQNLGSLIRAANAAGVHGIIIPSDRACDVTPAVVKASAGATSHAMIARETNLTRAIKRLKEENIWVAAIEADCKEDLFHADLRGSIALVIGSEGKGIRRLVRETCDFGVSIPMAGGAEGASPAGTDARVNSLNAAQAGAIAMFETLRQRLS